LFPIIRSSVSFSINITYRKSASAADCTLRRF
jgi:hypothetical protein